jgi:hypothetical protein
MLKKGGAERGGDYPYVFHYCYYYKNEKPHNTSKLTDIIITIMKNIWVIPSSLRPSFLQHIAIKTCSYKKTLESLHIDVSPEI